MEKFSSGVYVMLKTGGLRMRVRWYVDESHLEASWYVGNKEASQVYHEDELEEMPDHFAFNNIKVIDATIESAEDATNKPQSDGFEEVTF